MIAYKGINAEFLCISDRPLKMSVKACRTKKRTKSFSLWLCKNICYSIFFSTPLTKMVPGNLSFKTTSESLVLNNPLWLKRSGIPYLHVIAWCKYLAVRTWYDKIYAPNVFSRVHISIPCYSSASKFLLQQYQFTAVSGNF